MDLEAINKIRAGNGLDPLTELPGAEKKTDPEAGKVGEVETPEQIEAKRKTDEEEAARKLKEENQNTPGELDDAALLALLGKRGITVASLEELKKQEATPDPALVAEQREANELAFGLSKGLFNKKEYDQFVSDSQDPQDFVYAEYFEDAKKEDPTLTDEDIQSEFLAKYGLDAEPDSRKYKRGVKEVKVLANMLLKAKYTKIYDAKSAFSSNEKDATTAADQKKKITAALPAYNKDINDIFTDLKKIPFKFSDTESYEVDVVEDSLKTMKETMLKADYASGRILKGYEKENLKKEVFAAFLFENFPALAKEIANQHLKKHAAGTKGVPLLGGHSENREEAPVLTDAQKKYIELQEADKARKLATVN